MEVVKNDKATEKSSERKQSSFALMVRETFIYFLSKYYALGPTLEIGHPVVNKTEKIPAFIEITFL